jgi:hypothetical protein
MSLPYLHVHEGGVGYDKNRQLRFRLKKHSEQSDGNIVFFSNHGHNKRWTYTEILDLSDAFRQFSNSYTLTNCVQFTIEKNVNFENQSTNVSIKYIMIIFMILTFIVWLSSQFFF